MNTAVAAYVWYLIVAGPGGGMVIMPSAFDTRADCDAAIAEYQKTPAQAGWALSCVPAAAGFLGEEMEEPGQPQ